MKEATLLFDRIVAPVALAPGFADQFEYLALERDTVVSAARFDVKALPFDFVLDTGAGRLEELNETGEEVRSPFNQSIFEFADRAVIVTPCVHHMGDERHRTVECWSIPFVDDREVIEESLLCEAHAQIQSRQHFLAEMNEGVNDGTCTFSPVEVWNSDGKTDQFVRQGALLVLGVLTLLEERLLRNTPRSSIPAALNERRKRAGAAPVADHRVLTLNLAEARRRTKGVALRRHESPRLHWRRGSYHTLYRGSEFEQRVWHRRCLCGDPDKGFVQKHYRVIWQPTIH